MRPSGGTQCESAFACPGSSGRWGWALPARRNPASNDDKSLTLARPGGFELPTPKRSRTALLIVPAGDRARALSIQLGASARGRGRLRREGDGWRQKLTRARSPCRTRGRHRTVGCGRAPHPTLAAIPRCWMRRSARILPLR